jgi:serine/threonine-protein kinase
MAEGAFIHRREDSMTQPTRQPSPDPQGPPGAPSGPDFNPGATTAPTEFCEGTSNPPPDPAAAPDVTQGFQETAGPTSPSASTARPAGSPAGAQKLTALGDFKLIKKLGSGGMGEVYKGHQISLDRDAAIKVMARHLASNQHFVERFYREARLMAKLDHPNILRSFAVSQDHGFHYLAMEYVDGGSLQDLLKREGKLSVGDATHVILACARALEHAHEINVIHRDIKPDNILLTKKGVVKVADLGLAKALEEDVALTQSGVGAGTPHYMAPEQAISAKHADARSDIYALGCMFYCLLAGKPPFTGESALELLKAKEAGEVPPVRRVNQDVPERVDLIIGRMAARKPANRYPTCTELIRDLEGLGLANPVLSFFAGVAGPGARAPAPAAPRPTPKAASPSASAPPAAAHPPADPDEADLWWVTVLDEQRKPALRQFTTDRVKILIKEKRVTADSLACRKRGDEKRPLISFKQFEPLLRSHKAKEDVERKTGNSFKKLYDEIEAEERFKRRWGWLKRLWRGTTGFVGMIFWLLVLLGGLAGICWAVWKFTIAK